MTTTHVCALCGSSEALLVGRTGCACKTCLGEAVKQAIIHGPSQAVAQSHVTASDRCLMCGDSIINGNLAAARGPYRLCQACLSDAAQDALNPQDGFRAILF